MTCPSCGVTNNDGAGFCHQCGTALEFYMAGATARVREAVERHELQTRFLDSIAGRLNSIDARNAAVELLEKLFESDGVVTAETVFVNQVKTAFRR